MEVRIRNSHVIIVMKKVISLEIVQKRRKMKRIKKKKRKRKKKVLHFVTLVQKTRREITTFTLNLHFM